MNKNIILFIASFLLISCNHSLEGRVYSLIEDDLEKSLYYPETYDPAETLVDSAFTPFDDPFFYDKTLKLYNLSNELEDYNRKIKSEKSDMAFYKDMLQIAYSNHEKESYNQAKENYEKYLSEKEKIEQKIELLSNELKTELKEKPRFIGYKAIHRFRAQNNVGQIIFGEVEYLFNNDITKIISVYDRNDSNFNAVKNIHEQMSERNKK